jgi:ribonuclease E
VMEFAAPDGRKRLVAWTRMVLFDAERIPTLSAGAGEELRAKIVQFIRARAQRPEIVVTFRHLEEGWVDTPEPRRDKRRRRRGGRGGERGGGPEKAGGRPAKGREQARGARPARPPRPPGPAPAPAPPATGEARPEGARPEGKRRRFRRRRRGRGPGGGAPPGGAAPPA